jgi:hypothetical protein
MRRPAVDGGETHRNGEHASKLPRVERPSFAKPILSRARIRRIFSGWKTTAMSKQGGEFFCRDDAGTKSDRDMHARILGAVDKREPPIDERIMGPIRARHRARWQTEQAKRRAWAKAKAQSLAVLSRPCG